MATKKQNTPSAVSRFKIRDKFPGRELTKTEKQRIATQISLQLNRRAAKE